MYRSNMILEVERREHKSIMKPIFIICILTILFSGCKTDIAGPQLATSSLYELSCPSGIYTLTDINSETGDTLMNIDISGNIGIEYPGYNVYVVVRVRDGGMIWKHDFMITYEKPLVIIEKKCNSILINIKERL